MNAGARSIGQLPLPLLLLDGLVPGPAPIRGQGLCLTPYDSSTWAHGHQRNEVEAPDPVVVFVPGSCGQLIVHDLVFMLTRRAILGRHCS